MLTVIKIMGTWLSIIIVTTGSFFIGTKLAAWQEKKASAKRCQDAAAETEG